MEKYDEIISLGYNCEVSFRIEDYFGENNPMPFSWSYVLDRNLFPDAIRNIKDILKHGVNLCEDRMLQCDKYKLKYHPRYSILPQFGSYTDEQYSEAVNELKSRVEHLTDKFAGICNSNKKTLFIMKVENHGNEDNVRYIKETYHSQQFVLAVLMQKNYITSEVMQLEDEKVKVFGLSKFAPKKYTNILGDIRGWYRFFFQDNRNEEQKLLFMRVQKEMELVF